MSGFSTDRVDGIPLLQTLGVRIREIGERHAEMAVTVDQRHLNYYGGAHGGLIAVLIDTVCFFAKPLVPAGLKLTTVNLDINYVRAAAQGDTLVARSEILHLGRSTVSLSVRVTDQEERLVAHGSATLLVLA